MGEGRGRRRERLLRPARRSYIEGPEARRALLSRRGTQHRAISPPTTPGVLKTEGTALPQYQLHHVTPAPIAPQKPPALEPAEARALSRRGIPAHCASRAFSQAELRAALLQPPRRCVLAELDACGRVVCAGAGRGAAGAQLAAHARLAACPKARSAALQLAPGPLSPGPLLRLEVAQELAPLDELLLWPDDALLQRARVPPPPTARADGEFECGSCGALFEAPNALRVHRYLGCALPTTAAFLLRLLCALEGPSAPTLSAPSSPLSALAARWAGAGHVCLYCGKAYSRRYGLKIHIRTHTGYKPLRCRYCARAFGDPSNLNKHVRLHRVEGGGTERSKRPLRVT